MTETLRHARFRQTCDQLHTLAKRSQGVRPVSSSIQSAIEGRAIANLSSLPGSPEIFRAVCHSWSLRLFQAFTKAHGTSLQASCCHIQERDPALIDTLLLQAPLALATEALASGLTPSDLDSLVRRALKQDSPETLHACASLIEKGGNNEMLGLLIHHCRRNCAPIVLHWMRHAASGQKQLLLRSISRRLQAPRRSGNLKFLCAHIALGLDVSEATGTRLPEEIRDLLNRTRSRHQLIALPGFDPVAILGTDHREVFFGLRELSPGFQVVKTEAGASWGPPAHDPSRPTAQNKEISP